MNEITKLYENAGIEQTQDITCGDCEFVNYPEENKPCNACTQYGIKHHPPFTAEKQIELIKLLSKHLVHIDYDNGKYEVSISSIGNLRYDYYDTLEETLAYCINNLWQDLSEEDHKQIKEILE